MTRWQSIPGETLSLFSPIGLHLIDDLTGAAPVGSLSVELDERDTTGAWHATTIPAERSLGNVIIYPGLGRAADVATMPIRRYRVRLVHTRYRAEYLRIDEGIEFDVHPYDHTNPPAVVSALPVEVFLLPSASYAFPGHVRVLRGSVVDVVGDPVGNVEVVEGVLERVLTDERGEFALPLRWPALSGAVQIDAVDHRTGRSGSINVALPDDLSHGHSIMIN